MMNADFRVGCPACCVQEGCSKAGQTELFSRVSSCAIKLVIKKADDGNALSLAVCVTTKVKLERECLPSEPSNEVVVSRQSSGQDSRKSVASAPKAHTLKQRNICLSNGGMQSSIGCCR